MKCDRYKRNGRQRPRGDTVNTLAFGKHTLSLWHKQPRLMILCLSVSRKKEDIWAHISSWGPFHRLFGLSSHVYISVYTPEEKITDFLLCCFLRALFHRLQASERLGWSSFSWYNHFLWNCKTVRPRLRIQKYVEYGLNITLPRVRQFVP